MQKNASYIVWNHEIFGIFTWKKDLNFNIRSNIYYFCIFPLPQLTNCIFILFIFYSIEGTVFCVIICGEFRERFILISSKYKILKCRKNFRGQVNMQKYHRRRI